MTFAHLVSYFQRLEATPKRLEMFSLLADLFREAESGEIAQIVYFLQGELLPPFHGITIGMSEKYLLRVLAQTTGMDSPTLLQQHRMMGDIGKTAEACKATIACDRTDVPESKTVLEVYQTVYAMATMSGEGSVEKKIDHCARLVTSLSSAEAKYLVRFVAGQLRLGVGDATVLEALALYAEKQAGEKTKREIRAELDHAYNLTSDLGLLVQRVHQNGMEFVLAVRVQWGYPIRPALCERLPSSEAIIEKIGRCAVEIKYDGFRCQAHKKGDDVILFSRNQERTTDMFPEIVETLKTVFSGHDIILEGEALAFDESTGDALPFQVTLQRKRKHDVADMAKNIPLKFIVFDLFFLDGEDYTDRPYTERRETLTNLLSPHPIIEMAQAITTDDARRLAAFFDDAVERGFEGIVAKRRNAPYTAGSRNFNWIKLKHSYKAEITDTLDLCIVGYYFGKGARASLGIGTILAAVYDPQEARFKTVSKIGTGFSEAELRDLKNLLETLRTPEKPVDVDATIAPDVWVLPKYVVTVTADEITRSRNHTAGSDSEGIGFSLRFPRVTGFIRADKGPLDTTTVSELITLYHQQKRTATE